KLLFSSLEKRFNKVLYVWCRWEPFLFKPLIKLWKRRQGKQNKKENEDDYKILKSKKTTLLKNPIFRWSWFLIFVTEYGLQVFFKIRLKKFKKRIIISDRYFYDSFVDQVINFNLSEEKILKLLDNFWIRKVFPEPDLVIYIDCPEEIAIKRKEDVFSLDYLKDRRKIYLKIVDLKGYCKVDGALQIEEVRKNIEEIVNEKLSEILQ
ncbi:MAG TPA: hypothetical protein ENI51_06265, partial [Candidatus Atribacteria bacterium]|nr:hypothetical protein [Candidatus Atribacteria bacterium]